VSCFRNAKKRNLGEKERVLVKFSFPLKIASVAGLMAFAATALFQSAPAQAAARLNIQSGGTVRSAVLVEHERLKLRRRPLVIVLHPSGANGRHGHRHHRIEDVADTNTPVFLYPDPLGGEWPLAAGPEADRDVKFLRDLVDRLIGEGAVDPRKIYLVGESAGGVLGYRAVCAGIGRPLAGFAALGAAMPADLASCAANPLAYIAVNHAGDPRIPFAGGAAKLENMEFDALPAETALAIFAKNSGCGAKREEKPLQDHGAAHPAHGTILFYSGCKAPAELVRLEGTGLRVGHLLGQGAEPLNNEGPEFDAASKVWEFLKRNGA
jgi:polyhydroxybutyrate depolymerase